MTEPAASPSRTLPPWWAVLLVAVAVVAAAFAIGRFSAFEIAPIAPANDSAEAGFARDMQVHHAQAVEMAMITYRSTSDPTLRALAYDIATGQSEQRGVMYGWLVKWGLPQAGGPTMAWMTQSDAGHAHGVVSGEPMTQEEARVAMGMASAEEISRLAETSGVESDCLFLELMIRHHEGAVPMAEAIIELGAEPDVIRVAESMRNGQLFEIDAMASMQQRLGCTD